MADRFPSLDEFDAGQTEVSGAAPTSADESSDFLARERALLGDDAQQFASSDGPNTAATVDDVDEDDDDLLGGGGGGGGGQAMADTNGDMMGDFESDFPAVDTGNEAVAPGGGMVTGTSMPYRGDTGFVDEEEPDVVKEWRERRNEDIAKRDEISASKKRDTIKTAQQNIDEFYENYNTRRDKSVAQTRKEAEEFLKNREDTTSGGTSWERIAKLVDLSGKGAAGGAQGSAKGKMREVLLDLRKDANAPGATGV